MPPKVPPAGSVMKANTFRLPLLLLVLVLGLLFIRGFDSDLVGFSNDGPVGNQVAAMNHVPGIWFGSWQDLNSIGANGGSGGVNISTLLLGLTGPVLFSKVYAPFALCLLGMGAWYFFRQLGLSKPATILGALAAALSSAFFSDACWGVASHEFGLGFVFLALGLAVSNTKETPWLIRCLRLALAGFCVGMNVMEAADIGALYSVLTAGFIFFYPILSKSVSSADESWFKKISFGVGRVMIVTLFAGIIAYQTVIGLVGLEIKGIAGTAQDPATKAIQWDKATQWSLPKAESLGLAIPGLFGYRMDTPKDMLPALQGAYENGVYWGGIGRDPAIDRFVDSGSQGTPPPGFMRFSGGAGYCGILVLLVAAWTVAQSFRRQPSAVPDTQKRFIRFWAAIALAALLFSWGRFAPIFYGLLYQIPYFSSIRNPAKFVDFFALANVILFAYGIDALSRRHLVASAPSSSAGPLAQSKRWWSQAGAFDRGWVKVCGATLGASILGWLILWAERPALVQYLHKVGFPANSVPDPEKIAAFSLGQAGWFLLLFAIAIALVTLTLAGYFSGRRAKLGAILIGGFLVFDLGRANLPFIIHWDYKQKYEVGSLNAIVDFLAQKPYEHRVAEVAQELPDQFQIFHQLYRIEWMQHHFLYYNIQCLDIIQMSRTPENLLAYMVALSSKGTPESAPLIARYWQLTNTRYLLGPIAFLDAVNQQLDPAQHRFRVVKRFSITLKPGVETFHQRLEELTAVPNDNGDYAILEFTGALPRASLYASWQVNTNDQAVLNTLSDLNFDPAKTVLVSTPQTGMATGATNASTGTVEFKSYEPKHLAFEANATAPSVLLLNDKYDPNWRVTVDGQPAPLLRCNYIMRGVYLPPGSHRVEFDFSMPKKLLYVTLAAIATGIGLVIILVIWGRKQKAA